MSNSGFEGQSFESYDYDEVTEISEGSRSLLHTFNSGDQNIPEVNTESPQVTGELLEGRTSPKPEDLHSRNFIPVSTTSTLQEATMTTVEENDFDPELEDKTVEPSHSGFHTGQSDSPSTSGGGRGGIDGVVGGEGGLLDEPQSLEAVDFPPGPSHAPPPPHLAPTSPLQNRFHLGQSQGDDTEEDGLADSHGLGELGGLGGGGGPNQPMPLAHPAGMPIDHDDDDDDDDDDDGHNQAPEGAYDPSDYEHLNVSPEIGELFSYITRYTPQAIELEYRLRPYIPDYIPAVGDIDAFIKIPPPDGKVSLVGLEVLDEPSARQSDATVLDLQLRALAKHTTAKSMSVKTVENAEKNGKVIEKWVRDISELHRSKPPPTVHYSKRMPDIDSLMQEWPGEVEELLKEVNLPTAALDLDLSDYVDIICGTLDIPVYKNKIQSLHVLFTLYSVFKNSSHFRQLAEENYMENEDSAADHLVIQ